MLRITYLPLILLFSFGQLQAQDQTSVIIEDLNQVIRPIGSLDPDSGFQELEFLKTGLKSKRIIALGEATHGTHEFFQYKDKLIRFLVLELGFRAIAFESDFVSVEYLDEYINGKQQEMMLKNGGFPLVAETKRMLIWLKAYNMEKPMSERVHVYGLEARGFAGVIGELLDAGPDLPEKTKAEMLRFWKKEYALLTAADISSIKGMLGVLRAAKLPDVSQMKTYQYQINLLEQQLVRYGKENRGYRDEYMAENASWILENTPQKQLVLWAHNLHLYKGTTNGFPTLGAHLQQKYGPDYYVIATDFNYGNANVFVKEGKGFSFKSVYYPELMKPKSFEFYFKQCKLKNFVLDVNEAIKIPALHSFFSKKHDMRLIGGQEQPAVYPLVIAKNFDLILYFNETSANK